MIGKLVISCGLIITALAQASEYDDVSSIMKKYLSTVTCKEYQDQDSLQGFAAVTYDGKAKAYGVLWSGDKSCGSADGAGNTYVTPVVVTREGSLVVANEGEFKIPSPTYDSASFKDGLLLVTAPENDDNGSSCCLSTTTKYTIKYDENKKKFYQAQ
ncbi:MAG: hypothetical protein HRU23_18770 [Gammaproteobacteria bacterium]|nr:hypothetical protein [Gammaproteobacteria bacterium]